MRQSNLVALEEQLRAMHKAGLLILEHDSSGPTNRWSPTPIVEKAILNLASPNPIPLVPDYEFGCFPGNIQPLRDWLQSKGQAP